MTTPCALSDLPDVVLRGGLTPNDDGSMTPRDIGIRDGRISTVSETGRSHPAPDGATVIDATGQLVLPGFVNTHTHSYGPLCRHDGQGLPLEPWMMHSWARTVGRSPAEVELSATLQAIEAIRTGTTGLLDQLGGDVASLVHVLVAYEHIGIRAQVAPMIADVRLPDTVGLPAQAWPASARVDDPAFDQHSPDTLVDATLALHQDWTSRSGRTSVMFGPSAPQRCSPRMWELLAVAAQRLGLRIHTHALESRLQARLPAPSPARDWSEFLASFGLLSERLSIAHAVWVTDSDLDRFAAADVTLVHNPQSNMQLGSGIADVASWRRAGVRVALGTDGANCGGSLDMLSSMRLATLLHRPGQADSRRWETPASALRAATSAGALALGFGSGRLEVGAPADISVFDASSSVYADESDPLASLVLSSWDHSAQTVLIGGEVVLRDGEFLTIDEGAVIQEARAARNAIAHRNTGFIDLAQRQQDVLSAAVTASAPRRPLAPFHAG